MECGLYIGKTSNHARQHIDTLIESKNSFRKQFTDSHG